MLRITLRNFLIGVLVVLLLMILALGYLYFTLMRPVGLQTYQTGELRPLFSIYGKSAKADDLFKRPNDVAFSPNRDIYVTDSENGRVFIFDSRGRFLRQLGKKGLGEGEFQVPIGIAVGRDGTTYVTDKMLGKMAIFDRNGAHKKDVPLAHPMKPFVGGDRLYVTTADKVMVFGLDGRELAKFGREGRAIGEFAYPCGIAVDGGRNIYVADLGNLRVQSFKGNGDFVWVKGEPPKDIMARERTFGLPAGLAIGPDDNLYLVDSFYHQITVLAKSGRIIGSVGQQGNREGELNYPAGIASRGDGVFAVADKYNDRIQLLQISIKNKAKTQ